MATTGTVVVRLSDLVDGQEAICFAALVKKTRGLTQRNQPFVRCQFRDKRAQLESMLWNDHRFFSEAEHWTEGLAYRLQVRAKHDLRYGLQIEILGIRPAGDDDAADGYDFYDLVESSRFEAVERMERLRGHIKKYITDQNLFTLVSRMIDENESLFTKMPAAQKLHHPFAGGLLEHVCSVTRVAALLAEHYAHYYNDLDPPLDKSVVVAAAVLHDIGKVRELSYSPVEAKYTKQGHLIGHVLLGRDMVREAARAIDGFPEETLLLLEHAILAHHGKHEFGAPVLPKTIEAVLVHFIDDLDAKMNIVARARLTSTSSDDFTERVWAMDNRSIYKGIPEAAGPFDLEME
jgi:3'-5' exoribonuclease